MFKIHKIQISNQIIMSKTEDLTIETCCKLLIENKPWDSNLPIYVYIHNYNSLEFGFEMQDTKLFNFIDYSSTRDDSSIDILKLKYV